MPSDLPPNEPETAAPVEPPKTVQLAKAVWIGGATLAAVRSVVQLADRRSLVEQLRDRAPELGQDQLNSLASSGIAVGLVVIVGFLALNVWFATRMAGGRRWARVLITVFAGAELVFGVIGLVGLSAGAALPGVSITGVQIAFTVVGLVVDAVTLGLLFRPESIAFFRQLRAVRPPRPGPPPASPFI